MTGSSGMFASVADGVTWVPFLGEGFPCSIQAFEVDGRSLPPASRAELTGGVAFIAGAFVAKDVRWEDRIEFSDTELDWAGLPKITIHYGLTALDQSRMALSRAALVKISSIGRSLVQEPITLPSGSSLHYQGTYRMGAKDDGSSVCDPTGKVWGIKNLFLGGNGLIPTATACNPTLTNVALAVVGAEEILRGHKDAD
jgi:choline dehydrogenase-like flavoprotein